MKEKIEASGLTSACMSNFPSGLIIIGNQARISQSALDKAQAKREARNKRVSERMRKGDYKLRFV